MQNEKVVEIKSCKHCSCSFEITDKDLEFYEKVSPIFQDRKFSIPTPKLCPDCRQQRRLSFRNERKLYKRTCDFSGKDIISIYSPDKKYKVYGQNVWWSDEWDALDYGKNFDFSRSFFEQFEDLMKEFPLLNLIGSNNENSEYAHLVANCKNCYMVVESSNNEDCYYGYWLQKCNNCIDVSFSHECNNCYEIQDCYNCYNLIFSNSCFDSRDSIFLNNCQSCKNCFGCVNLSNKEYYIFNKPHKKDQYNEFLNYLKLNFKEVFKKLKEEFDLLKKSSIKKYAQIKEIENSNGDYMKNVKNCIKCFHAYDAQDCKYGEHVWRNAKDLMDVSTVGRDANLIYESINTGINVSNNAFCMVCWSSSFVLYCFQCFNSNNCFGCIGLNNKSYCIFNKQYTKEEYEIFVPKIIEHMSKTGEWGEFFPSSISPFGYNETVANEYFPMMREDVVVGNGLKPFPTEQIFNWSDYEPPFPKAEKIIKANMLPENITDIPDDILNWAIECEVTKKPFRIIKQELEFYRKHNLPIPRRHPDQRHLDRMSLRNPRKLFDRKCDKCGIDMKTTYSPDRKEIVYCEDCYEKEVY